MEENVQAEKKLVRERGLEPPPLTGPDPKSGASAISPLARRLIKTTYVANEIKAHILRQKLRQCCLVKRNGPQAMALNPTHAVTDTPRSATTASTTRFADCAVAMEALCPDRRRG